MSAEDHLEQLLAEHGFVLIRKKNHRVYRNPAGLQFTIACTASDVRAYKNALGDFKRLVGIHTQGFKPGVRREPKKTNHRPAPVQFQSIAPLQPDWHDALVAISEGMKIPPALVPPDHQVPAPVVQVSPGVPQVPLKRNKEVSGAVKVYGFLSDTFASALRKAGLLD